jgi:hypothetical protein
MFSHVLSQTGGLNFMNMMAILETGGTVMLTMSILEGFKHMDLIPSKFIPIFGLIVGVIVCGLGAAAGILAINGVASVSWYGIITGLMSCGLYSGVKNVATAR